MKHLLLLILLAFASISIAQNRVVYNLDPSFTMTVEGTSTLHDWKSDVTEMSGMVEMTWQDGKLSTIHKLHIEVPVRSIKSEKGRQMDNKTYEALLADNHPAISFTVTGVQSIRSTGSGMDLTVNGRLTLAGVSRNVVLTGQARGDENTLRVSGEYALKMTEYNIDPPRAMMGTLRTGEDVTLKFNVTFTKTNL